MKWLPDVSPELPRQAAVLARQAVLAHPDRAGGWLALGAMLGKEGRQHEALAALREGAARVPRSAELQLAVAEALKAVGDIAAACQATDAALALAPHMPAARRLRFELAMRCGRPDDVQRWSLDMEGVDSGSREMLPFRFARARSAAEKRAFVQRCDEILDREPFCTAATHFKALALARLGRVREADETMALDQVLIRHPSPPEDFSSPGLFHEALAREILANESLVQDPHGKATQAGRQTATLRQRNAPAVEALLRLIRSEIDACETHFAGAADAPAAVELHAWGVICDAGGHQRSHFHPDGWISGVYYVAAPRRPEGDGYCGPLLLGEPESGVLQGEPPWRIREVEPVPGRLVLFPSHIPHATRAARSPGVRISVAFDVLRRG
jgi:uncharacterized protein (TIGR02466 family)